MPTAKATTTTGTLESFNPATGELVGSVGTITPDQVQAVVDDVAEAQRFWAELPLDDRARYLRQVALAIIDEIDEIAELISREQGKPLTESYMMELLPTADALNWVAKNAGRYIADEKVATAQLFIKQKRERFVYEPLGVIGIISPWNYPWLLAVIEAATALIAGNGVVLKPASLTCLSGQKIQEVFERGGVPEGLVRVVHGGGAVGQALVESSAAKIFFTGSVEVGRGIGETCARMLKDSVLELGGKDPMIVLSDANLDHAIDGALWAGMANAGQSCAAVERVYVMHDVADEFVEGVVAGARRLRVGDPLAWETEIGPMASREQFDLVRELVDDAVANGATLHCGGPVDVPGRSGAFYAPAVLTGVNHGMRIMKEEIFGPVLPIITVDSETEAVALANDSEFGLGASVWTRDRAKGTAIAHRLETGTAWINDHLFSAGSCECTWGGAKNSGIGRTHGKFGLYECVNIKTMVWEPSLWRNLWWHPYDENLGPALRASAIGLYGRRGERLAAFAEAAGPMLRLTARTVRAAVRRR